MKRKNKILSKKLTGFSFYWISSLETQETAKLKLITATFIIPVLFPLLVREYSDFPFWTFGLMGASPENGHTPHGQHSAFQSFKGGGVVHDFQMQQKHYWHQKIFTLNDENTETPVPAEHHCIVATHNMEYSNLSSSAVWSHFCQVMMLHRDSTRKM